MSKLISLLATSSVAAALLVPGAAVADRDDIRALDEAKLTLVEAIQIAEAHQAGRAFEAKLEDDSFSPEYEVEVVANGEIYELTIDGVTGEVRKVKAERMEEDEDD
jgi:uncharacterized membrane protein YkoI